MTKEELIKDYETWSFQMQVYPHYKAWMDAEVAMYEMEFGEGQAFMHGFIECFKMVLEYKTMHDDELRDSLVLIATSNRGSDLKKAIQNIKAHYHRGDILK
jgi:hypothetical protein